MSLTEDAKHSLRVDIKAHMVLRGMDPELELDSSDGKVGITDLFIKVVENYEDIMGLPIGGLVVHLAEIIDTQLWAKDAIAYRMKVSEVTIQEEAYQGHIELTRDKKMFLEEGQVQTILSGTDPRMN